MIYWESTLTSTFVFHYFNKYISWLWRVNSTEVQTKKSMNLSFTQLFNNNMQVITQAVFMLSINTSKKK